MSKILAIDIDECVVDMWPVWLSWCNSMYNKSLTAEDIGHEYDLTKHFGYSCLDFWATPNLYQRLKPKEGCVHALDRLHFMGWKFGFVSYAKKGHFESKCDFINEWFPNRSFIHCTKEKGFTRCDVFIDDRNKYLNQQLDGVDRIKMETPYTQDEALGYGVVKVNTWHDVLAVLGGRYEN